jgi:hypothetical protein
MPKKRRWPAVKVMTTSVATVAIWSQRLNRVGVRGRNSRCLGSSLMSTVVLSMEKMG